MTITKLLTAAFPRCGKLTDQAARVIARSVAELNRGHNALAEAIAESDPQAWEVWQEASR